MNKKMIMQSVIRFILVAVVLGSLMIWFMVPTSTFKQKWLPSIRAKANSTYFGVTGANILIFTFPVLFISVLGCVYLHLGNNRENNYIHQSNAKGHLSFWKRTALVNGPLGIVSWTEISFLFMFIALLVWSFTLYFQLSFSKITPGSAKEDGIQLWEARLHSAGLRLGLVGNICLSFLFFPVARGSSVLPLLGLTSEGSIKYHIWLGHMVMILFTAHGLCYIVYFVATDHISALLKWRKTGVSILAGEISLVAGLAMWATSFSPIRRKMFNLFFYTHHLYIVFLVFFVFHLGPAYSCIMLPGLYLFLVDRYLRFLQSRDRIQLTEARVLPCEVVELNFSKSPGLKYTPTSIVFVNIPSISKLQWHPFTINSSSSLEEDKLSVVIKSEARWSKKLYQMLLSSSPIEHLSVCIEGPYGPTSSHFLRHDTLMLVSGGSGITPFISIVREFIVKSPISQFKTPRLITRFYVYPIDKNTNKTFPSSLKSLINMLLLCFCITAASTVVVFRKKRELRLLWEEKQTRSKESELESLPHQSLMEATNVHFGRRPDLKRGRSWGKAFSPSQRRDRVLDFEPIWLLPLRRSSMFDNGGAGLTVVIEESGNVSHKDSIWAATSYIQVSDVDLILRLLHWRHCIRKFGRWSLILGTMEETSLKAIVWVQESHGYEKEFYENDQEVKGSNPHNEDKVEETNVEVDIHARQYCRYPVKDLDSKVGPPLISANSKSVGVMEEETVVEEEGDEDWKSFFGTIIVSYREEVPHAKGWFKHDTIASSVSCGSKWCEGGIKISDF
ncbi:hypothetical protein GIB67_034487 [Kingdonia uniflora]|uniref:FAD-binding FR-type domain-containing protein n=1 Tax=Kingdonia uniflora TaxID=39325 RepID=A0A7J7PAZ4_9MAGN|nr:hypothetical protein GIB67_034487 [Kingdonia uniflora]